MPNDKILVKLFDHPRVEGSSEGEVLEVTVPNNRFAGTVCLSEDGRLAVEPDGCRDVKFLLAKQGSEGVHLGDKVGFLITHRGERHNAHRAAVVEKFGSSDYASECAKAILYCRNVRLEFPPEVLEEARAYDNATIDQAEAAHRMDLRAIPIFTIDSAETKDIDDAISLQKLENGGYELGVHIADVSHYVRPGSALDNEAYERATSIYYADKVIPMLPTQLSNGICSLNPQEDRFAFSCLMRLDEQGNILGYNFVKSVIRSRVKGVYKEINALLESMAAETTEPVEANEASGPIDPEKLNALKEKYAEVLEQLPIMDELYRKRLVLRKQRGGMEIESDEAKLIIDENGRCVDIVKRGRGTSECMIEEFMLLANQCAANAGRTNKVPFVYRVHEAPDAEKMEKLSATLLACGLNAKFKNPIPTQLELAALLDETRGQPIQTPVHTGILRSMQKARYAPQPLGHYGLVLADYAHFTSPIRRYPDLAIHRILSEMLLGANNAQMTKDFTDFAARASEQSSRQEVTAVRIERDVEDLYKAEYMHNHLGEVYMGTVAGITPRGVFVELENTVEGFVPAAELCKGEPQVVDGVSMVDPLTGRTWMLGTSMLPWAVSTLSIWSSDFPYYKSSIISKSLNSLCKAIVQALFYCTFSILFRFSAQHGHDAAVYCLRFVGIFKLQPVSGIRHDQAGDSPYLAELLKLVRRQVGILGAHHRAEHISTLRQFLQSFLQRRQQKEPRPQPQRLRRTHRAERPQAFCKEGHIGIVCKTNAGKPSQNRRQSQLRCAAHIGRAVKRHTGEIQAQCLVPARRIKRQTILHQLLAAGIPYSRKRDNNSSFHHKTLPRQIKNADSITLSAFFMAERKGFEPLRALWALHAFDTLHDFQSCALDQLSHLSIFSCASLKSALI